MKYFTFRYLIPIVLLFNVITSNAQTAGFNSSFAVLSINGGSNAYYDLQASTGNPDFNGANLGSFTTSNSLTLKGAEHNVYKCGGCDLTSTRLYYRVYQTGTTPGGFSNLNIGFFSGGANGCGGQDQQWANTGFSTNILSGLAAGNYTFEVYSDASVTCEGGTIFAGNLGLNYKATFTFCGSPTGPLAPGNYSIPGCFATVAAAATYLNTNGVTGAGTVQFDIAAGHTETAPTTGILLNGVGTAGNLATGTITTPIVFKKNGIGANPKITAPLWAAGGNTNGIVKIIGGDYITFDGITLEENTGNTVTTLGVTNTMTEVGFGLFLGSATNGAQNNTIKNCTITLNATFPNSIGIFSTSSSSATNTTLSATSSAGTNSFNTIVSNTISNVAYGVYMICQPITATVTETGNIIGGATTGLGNTITFGNATPSTGVWSRFSGVSIAGILYRNGADVSIQNNTINSNALSYSQTTSCAGVLISSGNVPVGVVYTANISNNTVSIINNGTTASTGIDFGHGILTTTHLANNNTISIECGATTTHSLVNQGIRCQFTNGVNVISGNSISINQSGVGPFTQAVIFINANGRKVDLTIQNNLLQSVGSHIKTSNITYGIAQNSLLTGNLLIGGSAATANTINISRGTPATNHVFGTYTVETTSTPTSFDISYNNITLSNMMGTGQAIGIYDFEGNLSTVKTVNNNAITISGSNTGVTNGMFLSNGIFTVTNNVIDVSSGSITIIGIDFTINGIVTQALVDNNSITVATSSINPIAYGINTSILAVVNGFTITNNVINSISLSATTGISLASGIRASSGTNNIISGNIIKDFSTGVGSGDALMAGIDLSGISVTPSVFNNKIYNLQSSFSGANSAINGITSLLVSTTTIAPTTFTIYNNFISNLSAPTASSNSAVNGIACIAPNSTYSVYHNTIKLGSSTPLSGGTNFGVKGIAMAENTASTILDLRNNIINLNVTPSGTGYAACVAIGSGVAGVAPLGFATTSNNNIYHINSNSNNYLFAQGADPSTLVNGFAVSGLTQSSANNIINDTNFNATCGYYKTFMVGTLDALTFTEDNLFAEVSAGTFAPSGNSFAENGAQSIVSPSITTDFNGVLRTPTNDIGALQFSGTTSTYTNPTNVASVVITALPTGPVLLGASVTFTATPTNGGAFPNYQWSINSVPVSGETNSTFTTNSLMENDVITLQMISDDNCVAAPTVTSNAIIMDIIYPYDTNVINPLCGATLITINQYIYANLISVAQGYRFKVTDLVTNNVQTIDRLFRVFQLTQLPNYRFDRTYKIEVAAKVAGVWQPYGNACNVTTPIPYTTLVNCNTTIAVMNEPINANIVPFATGYRFKVTNTITSAVAFIDRPIRDFRMSDLILPQYNTLYTVEIAVRNTDGTYLPYGSPCNVTTPPVPTSKLVVFQCDAIVNFNDVIFADNFVGATTYRFKIENTSLGFLQIVNRPIRNFTYNLVPGIQQGETYSVSVSIEVGTIFGPYGTVCTLTTPGISKAEINTLEEFKITAFPNPFSENFMLNMKSISKEPVTIKVYDMLGKLIENKNLEAIEIREFQLGTNYPAGIYNVVVSQSEKSQTIRIIKR